jgi:hypothetical protein
VVHNAVTRTPVGTSILLATIVPLIVAYIATATVLSAQTGAQPKIASCAPVVIQGRVTAVEGTLVTLKTPDAYPGGTGIRPQFVIAGLSFKIDISHARLLWPDGKQVDTRPLAVGDRVLMVLSGPTPGSLVPGNATLKETYFATVVERLLASNNVITH